MMIDFFSLFSTAVAFFIVAVSPGPATISNATIAMSKGRIVALVYGAGLSSGMFLWGVVAISGMGAVLQSSIYLLMFLKVVGGLYLLRLAYVSFKASKHALKNASLTEQPTGKETRLRRWFLRGFILNSSNPKTVVAWMAALSVGMGESMSNNDNGVFLVTALFTCMLVGYLINATYSIVFSVQGVMAVYQKASRWIDRCVAGLFAIAGVSLIRSAFSRNPV